MFVGAPETACVGVLNAENGQPSKTPGVAFLWDTHWEENSTSAVVVTSRCPPVKALQNFTGRGSAAGDTAWGGRRTRISSGHGLGHVISKGLQSGAVTWTERAGQPPASRGLVLGLP